VSNLEARPVEVSCGAVEVADEPAWELMQGREVVLGGTRAMGVEARPGEPGVMAVTRTLPNRERRMVGAWCFVDHFGYAERGYSGYAERGYSGYAERGYSGYAERGYSGYAERGYSGYAEPSHSGYAERGYSGNAEPSHSGMRIPPHPHTGLQTVTWLVTGEVMHHDSVGSSQLIRPGQLNLMTAGRAIAHSEVSAAGHPLHGIQLWTALPDASRGVEPHFAHHADLPVVTDGAVTASVLVGTLAGAMSPARTYSPLVGAQVSLRGDATLPLEPDFEYAALLISGSAQVAERDLPGGPLLYLGRGRRDLQLSGEGQLLLIGGEPFEEEIIMWWNFIGRSHEEIVADRDDWMAGRRFGTVVGFDGDPLPAPPMPTTALKPRGRLPRS
jgi:redox-sensitive bicupin YhaK (pirin superfamily)